MAASAAEVEERFRNIGGVFLTPASVIAARLQKLRALVFDWDGVFNSGMKGSDGSSGFSEPDSMGTNLLRFALWRERDSLPICAIVTGEHNEAARFFATREHFDAVFMGFKQKQLVLDELCSEHGLAKEEIAFVFDDVNDLAAALDCSIRILVRRNASPLLQDFVAMNSLCDYVTGAGVDAYPVRESAELMMGLMGAHDLVVAARMSLDKSYTDYFAERQAVKTRVHTPG